MGAIHWLDSLKPPSSSYHFEWEMKNFSSEFRLPASLENPRSESESEGGGARRKEETTKQEGNNNDNNNNEESEELERAKCEWDFRLSTVIVSSASSGTVSDTLGVIEFDPSDSFVATGGIARKIRIYSSKTLLPNTALCDHDLSLLDHARACDYYITTPAKLSSLRWRPGSGGRILGSGDYDGVVTEYDLERQIPVFERDEHGGRRVWSVDYSHYDPLLGASGSDDGTMQMWDPRCDRDGGRSVAVVRPGITGNSSVCSVEFSPFHDALVAVGCTDRKAYGYDIRKMSDPVMVLEGHTRTVTYVRFADAETLVSAGTDGCLKLWNVKDSGLIRSYTGHVNNRSFVGLSVWRNGGLFGCGSENNEVFVYDRSGVSRHVADRGFVSSVCWRQVGEDQCTLVAGGSDGVLQGARPLTHKGRGPLYTCGLRPQSHGAATPSSRWGEGMRKGGKRFMTPKEIKLIKNKMEEEYSRLNKDKQDITNKYI
ncbi:WD repeat-containing protein RUP2 [Senna tora]|uniref:WD repeat-containing protein RUP2 n=1 Tax=Senna tora TaxID=362788 RepID=A0A834WM31_9FABA|nr:WD repeat-containing protein RUP2 [Senna tora]